MDRQHVSLIVTDLDNTLFDWVEIWHASFSALLQKTADLSGLPIEQLEQEIKAVHQRHGTTEYAFSLEELPSLRRLHPDGDIRTLYDAAVKAFRDARSATLRLYPRVLDTLRDLKRQGCVVVGYTESMKFYSAYRLRHLNLDLEIDALYSPPDAELPAHMTAEQIERYPKDMYVPRHTKLRQTPAGEKKPNPKLLLDIVGDVGGDVSTTIYVGDSQMKDVAMAQEAGITEVWAKYGVAQNRAQYELLRRVTHWTDAEVVREKALAAELARKGSGFDPQYILEHGFYELLDLFEFVPFSPIEPSRRAEVLR